MLALFFAVLPTAAQALSAVTTSPYCPLSKSTSINCTANTADLQTWWHNSGEINPKTPVALDNVRQSHIFNVQVSSINDPTTYYDSFAYETIPRNGNGQICAPEEPTICPEGDGVSIETDIGVTMAWTQFLYATDAIVKITRNDGLPVKANNVIIRPTTLQYTVATCKKTKSVIITVPHSESGTRFSVEFQNDLFAYRVQDEQYVQNEVPSGFNYVPKYTNEMPVVGVEPRNALLIFASPFPTEDLVPSSPDDTYYVPTGLVDFTALNETTKSIVVFQPGVYHMTGTAHGLLSTSVEWLYLAPGAYVKGAIEYTTTALNQKASGFGVLSGEQYVYQANYAQNYTNTKSDATSLHLWKGVAVTGGVWSLNGITLNSPPFNSMDFYGDVQGFTVHASDYKQVGAFFGQTDGIEAYPGSIQRNIFYHTGDDTVKVYYSNAVFENIINWKTNNGGVIQFGWAPRNISNITITNLDVIHSRYLAKVLLYGMALIGSSGSYLNIDSTSTASTSALISDFHITNLRSEGYSPRLMLLHMLANFDNFTVTNAYIEKWPALSLGTSVSYVFPFTDPSGKQVTLGANSPGGYGLVLENYQVGTNPVKDVTIASNNWGPNKVGRLNISDSLTGHWTAI